ncbi:MAG: TolC family protein [Burkholderiales bacterium]
MKRRADIYCFALMLLPAVAAAQSTNITLTERLTLDRAIHLALENNRQIQNATLQVQKASENVEIARSHRLPVFDIEGQASQLLTPVDFAFPQGAFGEFAGIGPIPATDTNVRVPRQLTYYVSSQVSQPVTQLFRIVLGIDSAVASHAIELEHARAQRLAVTNSVKRLYFAILQVESALDATDQAIALYRELDRTLEVRVAQKVALRSDTLDVQFRLAQEQLRKTTHLNTLASQKEQLNQLLGRDVRTDFVVEPVSTLSISEIDLNAARTRALESRPDVREARLKVEQADFDRRAKKAERIPDLSVAVSYSSYFNIDVMPTNLAAAGLQLKWEPFDWGRKGRELASKTHTVDQARLAVRDAEDEVIVDVNTRFRTLAEKRALLNVAEMAQATSREKLRVKTNQYQVQAALLPDLLQLRAEQASSDDNYQQALLAFWTAKADFENAVGEEVIP